MAPNPAISLRLRLRVIGNRGFPSVGDGRVCGADPTKPKQGIPIRPWYMGPLRMRLPTLYPANMKALLLSQYNQLDLADLPVPVPGAEEILCGWPHVASAAVTCTGTMDLRQAYSAACYGA